MPLFLQTPSPCAHFSTILLIFLFPFFCVRAAPDPLSNPSKRSPWSPWPLNKLRSSFANQSPLPSPYDVSPPVAIIRMIAVPPRDRIAGSTKGLPYKVRVISRPKRRFSFLRRKLFMSAPEPPISYTVDLHGGIVGVGEYFSVIEIGGKKIRVQVDTGSSTLAVPMRGCSSCIRKANRYAVEDSSKAQAIGCDSSLCAPDRCATHCAVCSEKGACCSSERPEHCGFSLRYADGSSASGSMVRDEMTWGKLTANVTFGGILRSSPNFERSEVDGILGMAYKSLACNPSCFDPPFDSFVKKGLVQNVFSICMTREGGKLMLGGYDPKVSKTEVKYIDLNHGGTERYYRVALDGNMEIGSETIAMPNFRAAIVDTGTTLIVTSTRTFATLKDHFQRKYCDVPELCGTDSWFQSGMCVSLSDSDLDRLPNLGMVVGGSLKLVLRPKDYMLAYSRGGKTYRCVGIMGMDGLGGMVVLGNTLMQRYVTIYDRRNGRLGFAEAAHNCGD